MPGTFVFALVMLFGGAIAISLGKIFNKWVVVGGIFAILIGGLCTVLASANSVPVRNVGIVTSFNKPTGETTGSGLKWIAPWHRIKEWDASKQTADHTNPDPKARNGCTTVRIGSMATACVENKVRWQVSSAAAPTQYNDYKGDFENLKANLFETELQNAINDTFADYNPLANVDIKTGQLKFDGTALADELKSKLVARFGSDIIIDAVTVPLVHHDKTTEENIQKFAAVVAQNRILSQQSANADIEKGTAEKLKATLNDPYLINKCLDLAEKLGKEPGYCLMNGGIINSGR